MVFTFPAACNMIFFSLTLFFIVVVNIFFFFSQMYALFEVLVKILSLVQQLEYVDWKSLIV